MALAVILLSVLVLAVGLSLMIFGQASDARGKAQKSADAAVLAAAEDVRKEWVEQWVREMVLHPTIPPDVARERVRPRVHSSTPGGGTAERYARINNDSQLLRYQTSGAGPGAITVDAETLSEETDPIGTLDGFVDSFQGDASAAAEVRVGSEAPGCRIEEEFDDDDDEENGDDEEPTPSSWTLQCGSVSIGFDEGGLEIESSLSNLYGLFDIKLTD